MVFIKKLGKLDRIGVVRERIEGMAMGRTNILIVVCFLLKVLGSLEVSTW